MQLFSPSREAEIAVGRDLKESSVFATCHKMFGFVDAGFSVSTAEPSHLDKRLDQTLSLEHINTGRQTHRGT